jgi:hypothetical protein
LDRILDRLKRREKEKMKLLIVRTEGFLFIGESGREDETWGREIVLKRPMLLMGQPDGSVGLGNLIGIGDKDLHIPTPVRFWNECGDEKLVAAYQSSVTGLVMPESPSGIRLVKP